MTCNICIFLWIIVSLGKATALFSSQYGQQPQQMALITTGQNPKHSLHVGSESQADYSHKVSVRVSDVLTRQKAAEANSYRFNRPSTQSFMGKHQTKLPTRTDSNTNSMAQIVVRPQNSPPANALVVPMANSQIVTKEDRSWPPEYAQEFARVDVRVMGEKIDSEALLHLRPSSTAASVRKLRKILGPEMQANWMSIERPPSPDSTKSPRSIATMPEPDAPLLESMKTLNFTVLRPAYEGAQEAVPVHMTEEQIRIIKDWLLQRATCRMDHMWEDLGPLFWPRWIKRGICSNTSACSWPVGMRCRSSGSRALKLLRWVCSNDTMQKRRRRTYQNRLYRRLRRDGDEHKVRRRIAREDRRARRVRRLIRKLSLTANGYHCEWSQHEYMVSDQCSCGCG